MINTLGKQFAAALGILLLANLIIFLVLFWNANKAHSYMNHAEFAMAEVKAHMDVSIEAYQHILQQAVLLLGEEPASLTNINNSESQLQRALDNLETLTQSEIIMEGDEHERAMGMDELQRVLQLKASLNRIFSSLRDTSAIPVNERPKVTRQFLTQFFASTENHDFINLIEQAIAGEFMEIAILEQRKSALMQEQEIIIALVSLFSLLFALTIGGTLLRHIRVPVKILIDGTDKLASGELSHRVAIRRPLEFANLAEGFNQMATEIEKQHASLVKAKVELEEKVEERTKELHQLNYKLRKTDQARKRFLAAFTHELHTPLKIIRNDARGALKDSSENNVLKRIVDISGQMEGTVQDLLFLARAEDTTAHITMSTLALDALLTEVIENTKILLQDKNLSTHLDINGDDFQMKGDPRRLKQLFIILVDNAYRYTRSEDKITLHLTSEHDHVLVSVEDTGIGMDESELDRVFERFYRGKQASLLFHEGAGLGLPLAKAIVDAHRGEINISSILGAGTLVTVRLPKNNDEQ